MGSTDDTFGGSIALAGAVAQDAAAQKRLAMMQGAQTAAQSTTPVDHALALRLADKAGVDPRAAAAAVRVDKPRAASAADDDLFGIARDRPTMATWLADPHNYAVAQGDIPKLTALHDAIGGHAEAHQMILGPGVAAGYEDANVGTRILAAIALGQDPKWAAAGIAEAEKARRAFTGLRPSGIRGFGFDLVKGAVGMFPAVAGGFLGGATGAAAAIPVAGGLEMAAGVSGPLAPVFGTAGALVEAHAAAVGARGGLFTGLAITGAGSTAAGILGVETDLSDPAAIEAKLRDPAVVARLNAAAFKGGVASAGMLMALQGLVPPGSIMAGAAEKGLIGKVGAVAGEIGAQGAIMQTSNLIGQAAATGTLPTNQEFAAEIPGNLGAAAPFVGPEIGHLFAEHPLTAEAQQARYNAILDQRAATLATADHAALSASVEAAKGVPVRTLSPDRFAAMAQLKADADGVGTVYVNREAWDRLQTAAGKVPAVEAERLTGSAAAYDEARSTGDLEVDYGKALATFPDEEQRKALNENSRVRPGGPTLVEVKEAQAAQAKAAAEAPVESGATPEEQAADEARAGELTAALGLPEGGDRLLYQSEKQPSGQSTDSPTDALRATADAIEAGVPGRIGGLVNAVTGAEPVANAVRDTLGRPAATGASVDAGAGASGEVAGRRSSAPLPAAHLEVLARAAQRDPVGTAAALRELADINDRRVKADPDAAKRKTIEAAIRAAGRPANEAGPVARILTSFRAALTSRFPEVPETTWDRLALRFASGESPKAVADGVLTQGPRGAYDRLTRTIHLFETANESTLVHEVGHALVDTLGTLAADPDAPEPLRAMYRDLTGGDGPLTTEQHESLARQFEAYVHTGEAPSPALRRAFATLRTLMLRVYRSVRELIGADKIPEATRAVFDRMLATDDEIAAAQNERGPMLPISREDVPEAQRAAFDALAGKAIDVADAAAETLTRKVMADLTKEARARRSATLDTLREQETARLNATPEFVAAANMADGTKPDGSKLDGPQVKLSRDELRAAGYDEPTVKSLAKFTTSDGGVSPQAASEIFGFPSESDLLKALMTHTDREAVVDAAARARLANEHPELYLAPEARRVEARKALDTGNGRGEVLDQVIRFLKRSEADAKPLVTAADRARAAERRAAFDAIPTLPEARDAAERALAGKKLSDIKPAAYLAAERKARTLARDRFRVGDQLGGAKALGEALVRSEMNRQGKRLVERGRSDAKRIVTLMGTTQQLNMGQIDAPLRVGANAVIRRLTGQTMRPEDARFFADLPKWADEVDAATQIKPDAPPSFLLFNGHATPLGLNAQQLGSARAWLDSVYKIATERDKLIAFAKKVSLDETVGKMAAQIATSHPGTKTQLFSGATTKVEDMRMSAGGIYAAGVRVSIRTNIMDGGADGGVVTVHLYRPVADANVAERAMHERYTADFKAIHDRLLTPEEAAHIDRREPVAGIAGGLSLEDRLSIAGHMGNETGRQRLMVDGLFGASDSSGPNKLTQEQIRAVLESITPKQFQIVRERWALFDRLRPEIQGIEERTKGGIFVPVEPKPYDVRLADGTVEHLDGGYLPLGYKDERAISQKDAAVAREQEFAAFGAAHTADGFTHERLENVDRPVDLSRSVLVSHLRDAIHYITHREVLIDAGRIVRHKEFQKSVVEHYGPNAYREIKSWLSDVTARDSGGVKTWERSADFLRRGSVISKLAFNVTTAAKHFDLLTNAAVRIGPDRVWSSARKWMADPSKWNETSAWIKAEDPGMAQRVKHFDRDVSELRDRVVSKGGKWTAALDASYYMMSKVMDTVGQITWLAQYEKSMDTLTHIADPEARHAEAVAQARQAVEDTLGGSNQASLSSFQRGSPISKLFTTFMTVAQQRFNLTARSIETTRFHDPAQFGRFLVDMSLLWAAPAAITVATGAAANALYGSKPNKTIGQDAGETAAEIAGEAVDTIPFFRELAGLFHGREAGEPAGLSAIADGYQMAHQIAQWDVDLALIKSMNTVGGDFLFYPAGQLNKMAQGAADVWSGKARVPAVLVGSPHP